jgi:hypothetical protein
MAAHLLVAQHGVQNGHPEHVHLPPHVRWQQHRALEARGIHRQQACHPNANRDCNSFLNHPMSGVSSTVRSKPEASTASRPATQMRIAKSRPTYWVDWMVVKVVVAKLAHLLRASAAIANCWPAPASGGRDGTGTGNCGNRASPAGRSEVNPLLAAHARRLPQAPSLHSCWLTLLNGPCACWPHGMQRQQPCMQKQDCLNGADTTKLGLNLSPSFTPCPSATSRFHCRSPPSAPADAASAFRRKSPTSCTSCESPEQKHIMSLGIKHQHVSALRRKSPPSGTSCWTRARRVRF